MSLLEAMQTLKERKKGNKKRLPKKHISKPKGKKKLVQANYQNRLKKERIKNKKKKRVVVKKTRSKSSGVEFVPS